MSGLHSLSRDFAGIRRLFPVELQHGHASMHLLTVLSRFLIKSEGDSVCVFSDPANSFARTL
jgi:hypothetical protein